MVEKVPANGGPKNMNELTPYEVAILNRILVEFKGGVELSELFMKTSAMRRSLRVEIDIKKFKEMILSFTPELVSLKILVYPKLTKPISPESKELPLVK